VPGVIGIDPSRRRRVRRARATEESAAGNTLDLVDPAPGMICYVARW